MRNSTYDGSTSAWIRLRHIIQGQFAHAIGDKVRHAYERSQFWEEQKRFMIPWCDALTAEGLRT